MAENLKTTRYANGDIVPNVTDDMQWSNLTTGAWCYYDNDIKYDKIYGKLYNWYSVSDSRNVCPIGWHVPTFEEWGNLIDYLGGMELAGKSMKHLSGWPNNSNGTNSSGFSGIPGGYRNKSSTFVSIDISGSWLSSTELNYYSAYPCFLNMLTDFAYRNNTSKCSGQYIRCLKN